MTLLLLHYAGQVYRGGHPWKTGDWLINYSDGLIRRGFLGELAMQIGAFSGIGLKWSIFSVQAIAFVLFVYLVLKQFSRFKETTASVFLLLSPAFAFMFWVNSNATVFRKELLVYLVLVMFLHAFSRPRVSYSLYLSGLVLFVVTGLSHEIAIFAWPFLFFCIWDWSIKNNVSTKRMLLLNAPLCLAVGLILYVALSFKGSVGSMNAICSSLSGHGFKDNICGGAIAWLQYDAAFGYQQVLNYGIAFWINYLILGLISFVPLIFLRLDRPIWLLIVGATIYMAPLFVVAVDYGRFISILFTSTILVLIWTRKETIQRLAGFSIWVGCLYCLTWALPNCCAKEPELGFFLRLIVFVFGFNF
jgi:hypothetical protein